MKKIFPFIASALIILISGTLLQSFMTRGQVETNTSKFVNDQERVVPEFTKIDVQGNFEVIINSGKQKVLLSGEESQLENIITEVKNNTLILKSDKQVNSKSTLETKPVRFIITIPKVSSVTLSSSGKISGENIIVSDSFDCLIEGSGNMMLGINNQFTRVRIAGSGDLELIGKSKQTDVKIEGSGNFIGDKFNSDNYNIKIEGSGEAMASVNKNLDVIIEGSGNVFYTGNDIKVKKRIEGSGELKKRN